MTNLGISFLRLLRLGRGLQPCNGLSAVWNDHEGACLIIAPVLQKRGTTWQGRCKRRFPHWRPKLRHWLCLEQLPALPGHPPGPPLGLLSAGAIGRNSSSRIHLPVELRKKQESDPGLQAWSAG